MKCPLKGWSGNFHGKLTCEITHEIFAGKSYSRNSHETVGKLFVQSWKTEELGEKPLHRPPSGNQSTRQSIGIHGLARNPPSQIYPIYLSPSISYSNKDSWNRVLSSSLHLAIHPIASAKPHQLLLAILQNFTSSKTLSTLWIGVGCVWVQISSQGMTMREVRSVRDCAPGPLLWMLLGQTHVNGWSRVIASQNGGLTSYISPLRLGVLQ